MTLTPTPAEYVAQILDLGRRCRALYAEANAARAAEDADTAAAIEADCTALEGEYLALVTTAYDTHGDALMERALADERRAGR